MLFSLLALFAFPVLSTLTMLDFGHIFAVWLWSVAQWTPWDGIKNVCQHYAWRQFSSLETPPETVLQIQTISVQDHKEDVLGHLERKYGKSWINRPVLLRGLWDSKSMSDSNRRLSLEGLLKLNLTVPYFSDSRRLDALTPDAEAPVKDIVQNITMGSPHKFGTQLLVQSYPELINEVAPVKLITKLFGNHFRRRDILGVGNTLGIFPGTTTVPIFCAGTLTSGESDRSPRRSSAEENDKVKAQEFSCDTNREPRSSNHPVTGLHCEPIGNVAVQLCGSRQWTLIDPEHSKMLMPSLDPDGRGFFASWVENFDHVPRYHITTYAGDAVWVPTWTWHRVDYIGGIGTDASISIGASLFHFRPLEFMGRNPLYSLLILPALIKELMGISTQ